jgi:hypothetical protein
VNAAQPLGVMSAEWGVIHSACSYPKATADGHNACKGYRLSSGQFCSHCRVSLSHCVTSTSCRFEGLTAVVVKSTIFWDITPRSPLSVNWRFWGTYSLQLHGWKYKLSKKPARKQVPPAICSSETSVDTQRTTWRYIPEDGTLQVPHGCRNWHTWEIFYEERTKLVTATKKRLHINYKWQNALFQT